jgi:hypothetical protein
MIGKIVGRSADTLAEMIARYGHFSLEEMRAAVETISGKGKFAVNGKLGPSSEVVNTSQGEVLPSSAARQINRLSLSPMAKARACRAELYEKVWLMPIYQLAPEFGISDRGLGKICYRLRIPVPGRGTGRKRLRGCL